MHDAALYGAWRGLAVACVIPLTIVGIMTAPLPVFARNALAFALLPAAEGEEMMLAKSALPTFLRDCRVDRGRAFVPARSGMDAVHRGGEIEARSMPSFRIADATVWA